MQIIFGIRVPNRQNNARKVQELLTEYGCSIKTRIGLHSVDDKSCAPEGVILLEMFGDNIQIDALAERLTSIDGVELKRMDFAV